MVNTNIHPNRTKHAMQEGQPVIGTMVAEFNQPALMQILANVGFDFVIIDNEHGPFNIETIALLSRAAEQVGVTPVVRVPDFSYPYIAQTLDVGAQGIMLPRITSAQQVKNVVQMMKFPPIGQRGNAQSRGYTDFKAGSVVEVMAEANEESLLIVQIETKTALEEIEEIATIPETDVIFIGPNDLAISLGTPGQMASEVMEAAIDKTLAVCQKHRIIPAIQANTMADCIAMAKRGMRMISASSDVGLLSRAGLETISELRPAFE